MDFNQVRYFLALADTLNFTRAAERCYVSQPALTQAIRRLEDELGGELIHRDGKQSELTQLGKSLRGHFEEIDRTRHLVGTTAKALASGEIAELNIGVMCTIGPRRLAGLIDSFQMQHPMVSLVLHDVEPPVIPELLLSGSLDGVFCARHRAPHPQLQYVDLFEEAMVVAFPTGHRFTELESIPMEELPKERYLDRLHCEFREKVMELYLDRELELNVVFRSQREDWIQSLIRDGMGLAVLPEYSLLSPELEHRPIADPPLHRMVELAIRKQPVIPAALQMLIDQCELHTWNEPESS